MRLLFLILSSVLALIPFKASCQNFGCYNTPSMTTSSYICTAAPSPNYDTNFGIYKIKNAPNGYDTIYYKTRPWYPKQVKMIGRVENGKQEGKWLLYSKFNSTILVGNYINGLKEGIWNRVKVNSNGDSINYWSATFVHDTLDGTVIDRYRNGKIFKKSTYTKGLLNGLDLEYFEDGKVQECTNYMMGKKSGEEIEYDENSSLIPMKGDSSVLVHSNDTIYKLISIKHYINDTLNGSSYEIDWDGISMKNYSHGLANGPCTNYYSATGQLHKSMEYDKGILTGTYNEYYDNGQLAYTIICKNGLPYTSVCAYSKNGESLDPGTLKDGNGTLKCYFPNGKLKSLDTYKNQCVYGPYLVYNDSNRLVEKGELFSVIDTTKTPMEFYIDDYDFNRYADWQMKWISGHGIVNNPDDKETFETVNNDTSNYNHCIHDIVYYPDGKKKYESYTKDNLVLGEVTYYYENGHIKGTEQYKIIKQGKALQSIKDGLARYYFKSGKLKAEIYFKNNEQWGHSKYYDEAGNLMREYYVFDDNSSYNVFNGDTVNRTDKFGKKQGKWISINTDLWDDAENNDDECDINPTSIEYYKNGEPVGTWNESSFYGDSTKLIWVDSIKAMCYEYRFGKLRDEGYVLDKQNKIGHWKFYNTDGKKTYLESEGDCIINRNAPYNPFWGCRNGEWRYYKKNGKVKEIILYKDGEEIPPGK